MRVIIKPDYESVSLWTARYIADKINGFNPSKDHPFVLGLPTGSTPLGTYKELINLNKSGKVSFRNVVSFNMDEYVGLKKDHAQSYYFFMWDNFFKHIDILKENAHILDGMAPDLNAECRKYEDLIRQYGKIHLFMGGVGVNGHIAFNEPGSSFSSRTRVSRLNLETIQSNARFFEGDLGMVPKTALTVGIGTIMDAEEVILLANGRSKAGAAQKLIEGPMSHMCPVSALQSHPNGIFVCDDAATEELKVGTVRFFMEIEKGVTNE